MTKIKKKQPLSFNDLLANKKPATATSSLLLDPQLKDVADKLQADLVEAETRLRIETRAKRDTVGPEGVIAGLKAEIEAADAAIEDSTIEFTFKALGRKFQRALIEKYPPSAEQIKEFSEGLREAGLPQQRLNWDSDRFPPALIAHSCISHEVTEEEATELWDSENFNDGEAQALFLAAFSVNQLVKR